MKGRWFANDDIPVDILSRLSAKTLHCVKYVSKDWYNLISSRSFIRFQLKKEELVVGFFFQGDNNDYMDPISYIPVETKTVKIWHNVLDFLPEKVVILSSTNGLLCCQTCFPTERSRIYICNPLNKQWKSLRWHFLPTSSSMGLAFDPFQNPIDTSTDFKLVTVSSKEMRRDQYCFIFHIYSSKRGRWRRSRHRCPCNDYITKNEGVFVEGNLYWLTDVYQILMFDPENERSCFIRTPLPETQFNSIPEMCIGESEDKLNYVIISEYGLQLWVLEDHLSSRWGLKFSISLIELEQENPDILCNVRNKLASRLRKKRDPWIDPLAFKDGLLLLRVSADVYLYKFESRGMKKLSDISTLGRKDIFPPIVVPYAMSLVPLDQP